ncbi:glycoside hydrolase family 73 protein [Pelomonas sp. KK5]|uniref:glycoside hydrolase family 73 protein n=1 Tax=Pelomonas sp. KK5 TaxID=1855730 RepID=UPI001E2FEBAA|nr:glucosaminidase domain-containing protein [Pelomonas sp. KK5]
MLNADFGFLPLAGRSERTTPTGNGSSGFYQQLHNEVLGFIENGSPASAPRAMPAAELPTPEPTNAEQQAFLDRIAPLAREAGAKLGVAPDVLSAQAALESGWGKARNGNNLFGIKAGPSWKGETKEAMTTEFEQGEPVQKSEAFRAYPDAAASFRDLTQLLAGNPRYQAALQSGSNAAAYGQALQRGGYATDPAYADKLARVAARIQAGGSK